MPRRISASVNLNEGQTYLPLDDRPQRKSPRGKKPIGVREKEDLISLLVKSYHEHPEEMKSYFPELADKIEEFVNIAAPKSRIDMLPLPNITERERDFRMNSLRAALEKFQRGQPLSEAEALRVLEDVAALQDYAARLKPQVLEVAQKALGLPLLPEEPVTRVYLKGKPVHHTYNYILGMTLSLTWDGKLIKAELDADKLRRRHEALSIAGIASDSATDVAAHHDAYLDEIYAER